MTYVQFTDGTESKIVAIFASPQDSAYYPFQGELDEDDQRVLDFRNPPKTQAERITAFTALAQAGLDGRAQQDGYDSILHAVSYADEPADAEFQAQGKAYRAWRSKYWRAAYVLLAAVLAGKKPEPTAETLPGLLPAYEAPK